MSKDSKRDWNTTNHFDIHRNYVWYSGQINVLGGWMTSDSSHCDYSGLRCITVLKALKPKVQKGPFCIPDSLFFRLSSQPNFFPRSICCMWDRTQMQTKSPCLTVKDKKVLNLSKVPIIMGILKTCLTHKNMNVVINTHAICKLPPRDKGTEVHKQSSEKLSVMVVDNGDGSPLVQSAIFKFK